MSSQASVLFDVPGPRARLRNNILTLLTVVGILAVAYFVYVKFDEKGQWSPILWKHFLEAKTWTDFIIPGLIGTLKAAALGSVCALVFGAVFGLARLSDHWWIRIPAGAVVEFFRAIPLLLLIFFLFFLAPSMFGGGDYTLLALVTGLTLYNGSVLAEVVRAGVLAVPKGQSEAAYAIGLRKSGVLWLILIPQAVTAMMPAIVSQLVVLLKDTALGFVIAFADLLSAGFRIVPANYHNLIPAAIVISVCQRLVLAWYSRPPASVSVPPPLQVLCLYSAMSSSASHRRTVTRVCQKPTRLNVQQPSALSAVASDPQALLKRSVAASSPPASSSYSALIEGWRQASAAPASSAIFRIVRHLPRARAEARGSALQRATERPRSTG